MSDEEKLKLKEQNAMVIPAFHGNEGEISLLFRFSVSHEREGKRDFAQRLQ